MSDLSDESTLPERILNATESVLRRHGAAKTNVIDVARVLGMSHGNIYRHFSNKKALLDAVAIRWLTKVSNPLSVIANDQSRSASKRLTLWFDTLRSLKRQKVLDDPELFRAYHKYVTAMRGVTDEHIATLLAQLEKIIADGVSSGEFGWTIKPKSAAIAFLQATSRFHHPAMIMLDPPASEADARAVFALLLAGLGSGVSKTRA